MLFWNVWKSRMHLPACLWAILATFLILVQISAAMPLTDPSDLGLPRNSSSKIDHMLFKRRTFTSATPDHRIILDTYATFLPLSLAASSLLNFYTRLFAAASGPWHSFPELNHFTAEYGSVTISFQASHNYAIPWGFVAEFAAKMALVTEKGFTEGFQAEYTHLASGAVIRMGLRIVMVAAAA